MKIDLTELAKMPDGTIFQMEAARTELNEHEEYTYPAEMACLCQKGKSYEDGRFEYAVVVGLQGRVEITPSHTPLVSMTLDEIVDMPEPVMDLRPIIKVWSSDEVAVIMRALNNAQSQLPG